MASIADYLRAQRVERDTDIENLLKNTSTYSSNREVLAALGRKDRSKPERGLLSSVFNVLGAPGRLVQAGLLEAAGAPTPELQRLSGLDQVGAVLRGDVDTSASNLPGLKTQKGDTVGTRLAKMAGSFAIDVATDPLSFVSAPSSISRKAASVLLARKGKELSFLDDIVSKSAKGSGLIDDLLAKAPQSRVAELQRSLNLAAEAGTPLDVAEKAGRKALAAEELGNRLSETLLARGRQGLVKELEALTGSRNAALSVFKGLPEEVKGGIVLSGITGKPITRAGGEYVRLTQGTGLGLGKVGEAANVAKQAIGRFSPTTRFLSGASGPVLAAVRKAQWEKTLKGADEVAPGSTRLLDYVKVKDALAEKAVNRTALQGKALNANGRAVTARAAFEGADKDLFEESFRDYFGAPAKKFDATVAPAAAAAGFEAAGELRKAMNEIANEARELGLDIGVVGDPEQFSPLMLTDEAFERRLKLGSSAGLSNAYVPEKGRRSFVEAIFDEELAAEAGYRSADDPNVVYLNAKKVNDALEKRALAAGKTAEQAKAAREFIEDPVLMVQRYGGYIANAASNKRFLDSLVASGVLVKDVPATRRLLREFEAASFISSLTTISDEVRQFAETRLNAARQGIDSQVDLGKLDDVKRRIAATRQQYVAAAAIERRRVADLSTKLAEASAQVAEQTPVISQIKQELNNFSTVVQRSAADLADRQRAAKNVRARLATANANLEKTSNTQQILQDLSANASTDAERAFYNELLDRVEPRAIDAAAKVQTEAGIQQANRAELEEVKELRRSVQDGTAQRFQQQVFDYEAAVTKRNAIADELAQARASRDQAVAAARRVEKKVALEEVDNINALVTGYADALQAARTYRATNPKTANMDAAQKAAITREANRLDAIAAATQKTLRDVLRSGKSEFKAVAGAYADEVMQVAEKLSNDQFESIMVLTNQEKLMDYIRVVQEGARDDEVVLRAMGDIWKSFEQIRDILPESTFNKLSKAQERLVQSSNLGRLKDDLIREERVSSELAEALVDQNFAVVGNNKGRQDLYATSGVLEVMQNIYKKQEDPEAWRVFFNDYVDPIMAAWKTAVTIGRGPGYTANNLISGIYMNLIGDVAVSDMKLATEAVFKADKVAKRIAKTNPELSFLEVIQRAQDEIVPSLNQVKVGDKGLGDLLVDFTTRGGFNSTETAFAAERFSRLGGEASLELLRPGAVSPSYSRPAAGAAERGFRSGINFLMTNRVQRSLTNMAQTSEMLLRFSAFVDGYRRYGDAAAAMDKVHLLHFDYQDLSGAEEWVKRFVPFYTWARNNVPAQFRAIAMQPGKIQRALYANQEFQNAFGAEGDESWLNQVLPEYLDVSDGFASKFKVSDNNLGFFLKLPFEDINRLFKVDGYVPSVRGRELGGMLGPFTTPIELATGVNLQTGERFNPAGQEVPGYYRLLGPLASTGAEGETRIPGWLERGISDILPQIGTAERLASGVGFGLSKAGVEVPRVLYTKRQEEKAVANILNLSGIAGIFGLGAATITPRSISGELRRRQETQKTDIEKAAAEAGVDTDWIRQQLRDGVSPERIAAGIQAGRGRKSTKPERSNLSREKRQSFRDLLENL